MSVVVVGGGPAGLACSVELLRLGVDDVLVLDREVAAGGIPRHCAHQGFGLRDLRRALPGPRYARRWVELARAAGARVEEETTVTGWTAEGVLEVTSPGGRAELQPAAVVLATGCRERPRAARLVPGSRPDGVLTTGQLQQLVELGGKQVGRRALVVGAEHVSFSAVATLAISGARVVGMATELPRHQSLGLFRLGAALRYRAPLWTRTEISGIYGQPRVEEVELSNLDSGRVCRVACDTVVFTADWIPDNELAVLAGLELDPGTRGPRVDTGLRTTRSGIFAAGNLLHGAEPADVAALSGRSVAASLAHWLAAGGTWPSPILPIACRPPLLWISPNAVSPARDTPPRGRFLLRSSAFVRSPTVEIRQDGKLLSRTRLSRLIPGRSASLPARLLDAVDPASGPAEVRLSGN